MLTALVVSNVVLWILVVVLSGVVLALLRQVGVLHERISPAGALLGREAPRVGEPAPEMILEGWRGERVEIGGVRPDGRDTLLFFVSPTCPVCETLVPVVESVVAAEGRATRLIYASDGPRQEHEAFVRAHAFDRHAYVLSAELGLRFHVGKLPYAVLIDAAGIVRARGLTSTREHLESLFEARKRGVASVQEYASRNRKVA